MGGQIIRDSTGIIIIHQIGKSLRKPMEVHDTGDRQRNHHNQGAIDRNPDQSVTSLPQSPKQWFPKWSTRTPGVHDDLQARANEKKNWGSMRGKWGSTIVNLI